MGERIEKWLYDVRFAIEEIEMFLHEHEVTDFPSTVPTPY
jgi:hypothetical protein